MFTTNTRFAFLKSTQKIAERFNLSLNQSEKGKSSFHYCWASSKLDDVYYIDFALNVYKCTYSVGRSEYIIGKINTSINKDKLFNASSFESACIKCKIGGYCGGGCSLSRHKNTQKFCHEEKQNFDYFVKKIIKPIILSKLNKLKTLEQ